VTLPCEFRVSSYCSDRGCVGVFEKSDGGVVVGNTQDPQGASLIFSRDEWMAFIAGVKNGEFDVD
jgi:hypothetical protein